MLGDCPSVFSRIFLVILLIVKQGGQNPSTLINTQRACSHSFCLAQMCMEMFEGQMPLLMVLNGGSQIHTSELPVHDWTEA